MLFITIIVMRIGLYAIILLILIEEKVFLQMCFLKTGTGNCKYGPSCKYDHPRHGGGSSCPASLKFSWISSPNEFDAMYAQAFSQQPVLSSQISTFDRMLIVPNQTESFTPTVMLLLSGKKKLLTLRRHMCAKFGSTYMQAFEHKPVLPLRYKMDALHDYYNDVFANELGVWAAIKLISL